MNIDKDKIVNVPNHGHYFIEYISGYGWVVCISAVDAVEFASIENPDSDEDLYGFLGRDGEIYFGADSNNFIGVFEEFADAIAVLTNYVNDHPLEE